MTTDNHELDLLPAYALGSLDEADAQRVAGHLAACPHCRAELLAFQQVSDELALAVPQVAPPPVLKKKLMDRVRPRPAQFSWVQRVLGWQRPRARQVWASASLALIAILAVSNLLLWFRFNELKNQTLPQVVALQGTHLTPGATGVFVIGADGYSGTLVVNGLSPLDETHQYQLWLIQDGRRTSGGVFSVSEKGYGTIPVVSGQPFDVYQAVGITIEPAGGSPGPTGDKVMGGDL